VSKFLKTLLYKKFMSKKFFLYKKTKIRHSFVKRSKKSGGRTIVKPWKRTNVIFITYNNNECYKINVIK